MTREIKELLQYPTMLGCSFDDFQRGRSCELSKQYHADGLSYSVFIGGDEYMFVDDELHSIELYSYNSLFNSIESTMSKLNEEGVE